MSTPYAGSIVFPADFLIPDDGDAEDAMSVNVALEALGDRTAWLAAKSPRMKITPFLASGTYTPNAASRIVAAWVWGCGGGGAGGNGIDSLTGFDKWFSGGGGGGAAIVQSRPIFISPGTTYNIDIGAGGTPPSSISSADGGDGGDTIFRNGATNLAVFPGAQGGKGAAGTPTLVGWSHFTLGGFSRRDTPVLFFGSSGQGIRFDTADPMWTEQTMTLPVGMTICIGLQPGQGGWGAGGSENPLAGYGGPNPHGRFAGGARGLQGADVATTQRGGGGGGGGAAGPFGDGGAGGNGGDAGTAGHNGGDANANSGAGGGGGGTAGYYSPSSGLPLICGVGGSGGSGRLYLVTIEESP